MQVIAQVVWLNLGACDEEKNLAFRNTNKPVV
jgi:hypothetical protein